MLNVPTLITSGTNLNLDAEIISPAIHLRSPTPIQASMLTRRVYENHSRISAYGFGYHRADGNCS
jgi:hypothetical protein